MKNIILLLSVVLLSISLNAQNDSLYIMKNGAIVGQYHVEQEIDSIIFHKPNIEPSGGTFTDARDGNVYQTVTIGNQVWMAENLKYLPSVVGPGTGSDPVSETDPYYYVYGYGGTDVATAKQEANYLTYGVLYNWPAAMAGASSSNSSPSGVQGVCPDGWHLPSDNEWKELEMALGMSQADADAIDWRGTNEGSKLADNTDLWNDGDLETDSEFGSSGFSALPGGYRYVNGSFLIIGNIGIWWSATEWSSSNVWYRSLFYDRSSVEHYYNSKNLGFSVRCVRD